ncbi:MAG: aldo/keto reductase family protein [Bradymonadaceae bacterium]
MTDASTDRDTPDFIYGTAWKEDETADLTKLALECGFRGIDTANQRKHYHEAGVGEAITEAVDEGLVERDELFLQTKFTYEAGQDHRLPYDPEAPLADQVEQSFESSLDHLGVEFIDSYILHGPSSRVGLGEADREVWEAMTALAESGRVGAIGISNVSPGQVENLVDWADLPPAFVQNRCFARTEWGRNVREICRANDIVYQGFSLLTANVQALQTDDIARIAKRHDKTIPQVVFRFASQIGILPLTGTTSEEHMRRDLACFDFELDDSELDVIENIATA